MLYAIGIPGVGEANARVISAYFHNDLQAVLAASPEELAEIEGIGPVLAGAIAESLADPAGRANLEALMRELSAAAPEEDETPKIFEGKTFVITGKVHRFDNRDALKEYIIKRGGKAAGSVSARTDYLINNDVNSNSAKNKKARQLGIPVLSEEDFLRLAGED